MFGTVPHTGQVELAEYVMLIDHYFRSEWRVGDHPVEAIGRSAETALQFLQGPERIPLDGHK